MNGEQHQPGAPTSAVSFAPAPTPSSRPSPFSSPPSAILNAMAAPSFLPSAQTSFRAPAPATQSPYPLAGAATAAPVGRFADADAAGSKLSMLLPYIPSPAAASSPSLSSAVIRMLPLNTSEESI